MLVLRLPSLSNWCTSLGRVGGLVDVVEEGQGEHSPPGAGVHLLGLGGGAGALTVEAEALCFRDAADAAAGAAESLADGVAAQALGVQLADAGVILLSGRPSHVGLPRLHRARPCRARCRSGGAPVPGAASGARAREACSGCARLGH